MTALAPLRLGGRVLPLLDRARVYACGITPYDVTHLGHAATYVRVDLLTRALRDRGVTPLLCRNVTDVDDVLTAAAERAGAHYDQFAYLQQFEFDRDLAALGVRRPDLEPRARHHVEQVVQLAAALLEQGSAYQAAGSVFLPGEAVAATAQLAPAAAHQLAAEYGGRLDDPAKRHPLDSAIWQSSGPDEPGWDSPWGRGRPGWHAGCTVMALGAFGPSLDVHCGGEDLRFPHHAFEAALAEQLTGVTPFARSWLHVGLVRFEGAKMAKSVGNLVLVGDLLRDWPAAVLRMLLLNRPTGAAWDYRPELLVDAAAQLDRLRAAAQRSGGEDGLGAVRAALADELDVPAALAAALDSGGAAAELLLALLGLDVPPRRGGGTSPVAHPGTHRDG